MQMTKSPLLSAAVAALLASTPALANDAELLQQMKAQMLEMQRKINMMEQRLQSQEQQAQAVNQNLEKSKAASKTDNKAVRMYGQANISLDHHAGDWGDGTKGSELASNASRIGIKGEMPTNLADTALFYQLELLYNTTGASDSNVDLREAWAGLQGGWGSMRGGRVTVPYKKHYTVIDPWTDNAPQARSGGRQGVSELHSNYFNHALEYKTPKFAGGVSANIWAASQFDNGGDRLHNAGALVNFLGGQAYGLGTAYKNKGLFAAADWLKINADEIAGGGVENGDAWQLMAQYKVMKALSFALLYEDASGVKLGKNVYLNGIYRVAPNTRLIAAYGRNRDRVPNGNKDWNNWSLGFKYTLTGESELYAAWNRRTDATSELDYDTFTLGVNVRFGQ